MELSENKSAIMFIKKATDTGRTRSFEKEIEKIPIVRSYKYLGVIFEEDLCFKDQTHKICENIKKKRT